MNYCDFGETLRQLRKNRNLTQKELGLKIGLSKAVISKYETGMGYPTFDVLIQMARYFGVTTDYLLGVSGSKTINVSALTNEQTHIIQQLVSEFTKANKNSRHDDVAAFEIYFSKSILDRKFVITTSDCRFNLCASAAKVPEAIASEAFAVFFVYCGVISNLGFEIILFSTHFTIRPKNFIFLQQNSFDLQFSSLTFLSFYGKIFPEHEIRLHFPENGGPLHEHTRVRSSSNP